MGCSKSNSVFFCWYSLRTNILRRIEIVPDKDAAVPPGRIAYIDFLKFISLTGIILAHVGSPNWVMMARSFDVPLMVILSAMLAVNSYRKYEGKKHGLIRYYWGRVKRLVLPTWIFLLFFFFLFFLVTKKPFALNYYTASFCLTSYGIGYVWVILMYLYSALLVPLYAKTGFSFKTSLCLLLVYLLYEIAHFYSIGTANKLIDTTFYYLVPYGGVLSYFGYHYHQMKHKNLAAALSFLIFAALGAYYWHKFGSPQLVQIAKYPPRCYYLSYGIAISLLLLILCERNTLKIYRNPLIVFISKHSMWIYLWHILLLYVYSFVNLPEIWYIKLILVYSCSIGMVIFVNKVLDLIEKRHRFSLFKYLRG